MSWSRVSSPILPLILLFTAIALVDASSEKVFLKPTVISLNRNDSYVYTYGARRDDNMDTKIYQSVGNFEWQQEKTKYMSILFPEHWPLQDFFEVTYVQVMLRPLDVSYEVSISGPIDSALITIIMIARKTRSLYYEIDIYGYK